MTVYNKNRDSKWEIVKNDATENYTVTYYERYDACDWKQIGAAESCSKECAEYEFDINLDETEKEETEMKKFEVGAMYWDTSAVDHSDVMIIKITRRTEKSVWFVRMHGGKEDGEPSRTKIFTDATREYVMPYKYSMAPVWMADRKAEPETAEETADAPVSDEPAPEADAMTTDEPETETPDAAQEPEAADDGAAANALRSMGELMNKLLDNGNHEFAHGVKLDIERTLSVGKEYADLEVEYDAGGRFVDVRERKPETADDGATNDKPDAGDEKARNVFAYVCEAIAAANGDAEKLEALRVMVDSVARNERLSPELRHIEIYLACVFRHDEDVLEALDLYYDRGAEETAQHFEWTDFPPVSEAEAEAGQPAPQGEAAPEGAESVEAESETTADGAESAVSYYEIPHIANDRYIPVAAFQVGLTKDETRLFSCALAEYVCAVDIPDTRDGDYEIMRRFDCVRMLTRLAQNLFDAALDSVGGTVEFRFFPPIFQETESYVRWVMFHALNAVEQLTKEAERHLKSATEAGFNDTAEFYRDRLAASNALDAKIRLAFERGFQEAKAAA